MPDESIIIKEGKKPGKTVAIFGGIHGNETVGIRALAELIATVTPDAGKVYFVYGNPPAIKENKRFLQKNINRLFSPTPTGTTYEDLRAQELLKILNESDALLDIHSFNSDVGEPFIICEESSFPCARELPFSLISTGWSLTQPTSSDGYMALHNKTGLCIECGPAKDAEKYVPLALESARQFLAYFGCLDGHVTPPPRAQKIVSTKKIIYKKTPEFAFVQHFENFDTLPAGEVFATDGDISHIAAANECIIFPRPNTAVGDEACVIGEAI